MRNESSFVLTILLLVTVLCGSVFAEVISVDDDGPADYSSIQAAINNSADGDVIRVEPGYYYENIYFYGKAVLVTSIDPYDPNIVGTTVIYGGEMDSVVTFAWDEGPGSIIDGFRITGGRALYGSGICCWESSPTIRNNTISGNGSDEDYAVGGGIYCYKSEAVIEGNQICFNYLGSTRYELEYTDEYIVVSGGGIYCDESNVSIRNNSIYANELYGTDVSGGGIFCYQSTGQIEGNRIEGNDLWGGFLETAVGAGFEYESPVINGAGIYCYQSAMRIENNQIERNERMAFFQDYWYEGFGNGGGIYCEDSPVEIVDNRISMHWGQIARYMLDNMLDDFPGAAGELERNGNGGGLYIVGSSATITGNEVFYNESFSRGAGIYCDSSSAVINDNIIAGNRIDYGIFGQGGGIYVSDSRDLGVYPEISDNLIWENYAMGIEFDDGYPARDIGEGGGIYCNGSSPLITNNIIARNMTELYGGGIFCSEGSSPAIVNNTILGNSSWNTGASVYLSQDSCPTIKNNIIVKNSGGGVFWKYTNPSEFSYNCVWGNTNGDYLGWAVPGEGGISEDPGFADVCDYDYHLKSEYGRWDSESEVWVFDKATSMCVNAGDPSDSIRLENTPNGYRINMGAYGGTVEASKLPVGTERCTEVLAGDVNGDCMVDLDDLTVTVSGWLESVDSWLDVNTMEQEWTAKYGGEINSPIIKMITDSQDNIIVVGTVMQDYVTIKYDTEGNELWSVRYDGTGAGSDDMTDAAVDSSDNIYVTGLSYNGTDGDYATVKYDPDGNELWVARYDGPDDGWDHSHAIAVDSLDNVYVTGSSYNGFNDDYVTIKYDLNGNEVWVARYDGPDDSRDRSRAIAIDSLDNIYVNGESRNYCTTVKYDPDGTELWVARDENILALYENAAIAIDSSDNVYVIGFDANYYPDYDKNTLVKYGPDGSLIWEVKYGLASYDDKVEILLDSSEKIYVVGDSYWGGYTLVKFDPNGTEIWIAESEPESWYMMNAMTIDSSDNIYLTGVGYRNDDLIIKYDSNGNLIGTAEYECPDKWDCYSFGGGYGIAVDSMGNVYVTGESWDWDSNYEYYGMVLTTIKYSPYVCEQPLQGDVNGDCAVNFIDFAYICKDWLDCNLYPLEYCVQ